MCLGNRFLDGSNAAVKRPDFGFRVRFEFLKPPTDGSDPRLVFRRRFVDPFLETVGTVEHSALDLTRALIYLFFGRSDQFSYFADFRVELG